VGFLFGIDDKMQFNEMTYHDATPVEAYGAGYFRIADTRIEGGILAYSKGFGVWSGYEDITSILELKEDVDFILLGTGDVIAHPPSTFRASLEDQGIGVEIMNTPSACRTYNVLLSEGRRVALVALAVTDA
jgi:uncharacterized protein